MDMLEIRAGNQYNMAKYWLQSRASPIAMEIKLLLQKTLTSQKGLMEQDFLQEEKQGKILPAEAPAARVESALVSK